MMKVWKGQLAGALLATLVWCPGPAQAQAPAASVTSERAGVRFTVSGAVREWRVQVQSLASREVFDSGSVTGSAVEWKLRDAQSQPVPAGVYVAVVTLTAGSGQTRQQVEVLTVTRASPGGPATAASITPRATLTGSGTTGKIPKWTGTGTLGNSVVAESAGKIGIGTATPAATLTVMGGDILIATAGKGLKFADGKIQTTAGLGAVAHNPSLAGSGTAAAPLAIAAGGVGAAQIASGAVGATQLANGAVGAAQLANGAVAAAQLSPGAVTAAKLADGAVGAAQLATGAVTSTKLANGAVATAQLAGGAVTAAKVALPLNLSGATTTGGILKATNTGSGNALEGISSNGDGVFGKTSSSLFTAGVEGVGESGGDGVRGSSDTASGVIGSSDSGIGVQGFSVSGNGVFGSSAKSDGIEGRSFATGRAGVIGINNNTNGGFGVVGQSSNGTGVEGQSTNGTGVRGVSSSDHGAGVFGKNASGSLFSSGVEGEGGNGAAGVFGHSDSGAGVLGTSQTGEGVVGSTHGTAGFDGVVGINDGSGNGVRGESTSGNGVQGKANLASKSGVFGNHTGSGEGVFGQSASGFGIAGFSTGESGVVGQTNAASKAGVFGFSTVGEGVHGQTGAANKAAVSGINTAAGAGVIGQSSGNGVEGNSSSAADGAGVVGAHTNGNKGGLGALNAAVKGIAAPGNRAGLFTGPVQIDGNLTVNGTLFKTGGAFRIDHPLEPGKYLIHSFVESPDMMCVYNGNTTTDSNNEATVQLPDWFSALNRDFRYQLTCIGQFAQAIVAQEIANNAFVIRTDRPNVKVSWQVTGIRQDAWANAHRIPVTLNKSAADRAEAESVSRFSLTPTQSLSTPVLHQP